jgi:diguanylate cyclase (GGDEF)-like protein
MAIATMIVGVSADLEAALAPDGEWAPVQCVPVEEAAEAVRAQQPARLLLDVDTLGQRALELLGAMDDELARIPVLAIGSPHHAELLSQCLLVGASDYLIKPLRRAELSARLAIMAAAHQSGQLLRERAAQTQAIFEQSPVPMLVVDERAVIHQANPALMQLLGGPLGPVIGLRVGEALGCAEHAAAPGGCGTGRRCPQCPFRTAVVQALSQQAPGRTELTLEVQREGVTVPLHLALTTTPIRRCGRRVLLICLEDITTRRIAEDELQHAVRHDPLTGLPNRRFFAEHVVAALDRLRSAPQEKWWLLFLDLDRFKVVNDGLGHAAGDELLVDAARRIRQCLRQFDADGRPGLRPGGRGVAARLGGDEFAVLLQEPDRGAATALATTLRDRLSEPISVRGHSIQASVSVGIVAVDSSYRRPEELIRDADTAMYEAKAAGRGRCVAFSQAMRQRVQARLTTETELRTAVERGELVVHYQPIVCLNTGRTAAFEALVRWSHPTRGLVPPGEFIGVAEETGLILPLGRLVLRQALEQLQRWGQSVNMAINVSRNQLRCADFAASIRSAAAAAGVDPGRVDLEITESTVMADPEAAIEVLNELKKAGFRLVMDDFGTGHSSLACLHQFPFDVVKIDRSFVANMAVGQAFTSVVTAIIMLARNLRMQVIAEGIETREQLVLLQSLGCEFGQGYLFGRPAPAQECVLDSAASVRHLAA